MFSLITWILFASPVNAQDTNDEVVQADGVEAETPVPLVTAPELIEYAEAPYPQAAKDDGIEGIVRLLIEIDEYGDVGYVEVLQPAGHGFDEAAVAAAWQFVFTPAEDVNGPVPVALEFEYGFVLDSLSVQGAVPEEPTEEVVAPINLDGAHREMGTRRQLADIPVQLIGPDDNVTPPAITDESGAFSFRGVPDGEVTLRVVYPDFYNLEKTVSVVEGQVTSINLWIKNLNYRDDELVGVYRRPSSDISRRVITVEEMRRIPGTFGDPVRVIQTLPGAARAPFGTGGLIIRGANPEDSGVYIDGIRVPLIYHLGGLVSIINSDLIKDVNYLPGGYGVQYGRSTGGVVDVTTRNDFPEQHRIAWSTDLLDSGGIYAGRTGNLGVAVAARRSYIDAVIPLFTRNSDFVVKPRWYDYQLKVDMLNAGDDELSFFAFGFQDALIASSPEGVAQGTDEDFQGDLGTTNGSHRAYIRWLHPIGDTLELRLTPSIGVETAEFNLGDSTRVWQNQVIAEIRNELLWDPVDSLLLTGGMDLIAGPFKYEVSLPFSPESFAEDDPLSEDEAYDVSGEGMVWAPDFYAKADIRPLNDKDQLLITAGIRHNSLILSDEANTDPVLQISAVDPRLSARWRILPHSFLKAGGGVYHQPPLPFEAYRPEGNVEIDFERSRSAEIGWEQTSSNNVISADVSLFYKWLDNMIVDNPDFENTMDQYYINTGVGRIYGSEMILRHAPINRFFGWVSYTLSKSERNDDPNANVSESDPVFFGRSTRGEWYPFEFDQTHILVAVAGWQLPRDWGISAKVQYVTGNPYTPYSGGVYDIDTDSYFPYASGEYNQERLPEYFAFDARVDKLFTFKRWQLEVYLDMLNAIRGENPEFVIYNYDFSESAYIRGLPFIPSLGFEVDVNF